MRNLVGITRHEGPRLAAVAMLVAEPGIIGVSGSALAANASVASPLATGVVYDSSGHPAVATVQLMVIPPGGLADTYTYNYYSSEWKYGIYYNYCEGSGAYYGQDYAYYSAEPTEYAGGAMTTHPSGAPTANYCVYQEANSNPYLQKTTAITWTNGVNSAYEIGINLSSRTGYSSTAWMQFHFTAAHYLCGTGDYPGGSHPYQLVARP